MYVHFSCHRFYIQHLLHLQDVIYMHDRKCLHLFSSEIFADHYACILFPRIIVILFLPSYPHQASSDSLDLNKLQLLLSIFCYYLFLLRKHPKVPVRISAPTVPGVHIDIPCPGGYLSTHKSIAAI